MAVAFFGGSVAAYATEHFIFAPELEIAYRVRYGKVVTYTTSSIIKPAGVLQVVPGISKAMWIRLCVENSRWGVAKNCRAYLADVQRQFPNGERDRIFWDCMPLEWANDSGATIDIPTGIKGVLDVMRSSINDEPRPWFVNKGQLDRFDRLFGTAGTYFLTVLVSADNARAKSCCLQIDWNGEWDQIEVSEAIADWKAEPE